MGKWHEVPKGVFWCVCVLDYFWAQFFWIIRNIFFVVFFACVTFVICSMIELRKERNMQRFSVSLLGCLMCLNAFGGAALPVVDVSSGNVSARAAFGEEIMSQKSVAVAPLPKKTTKKVVARRATKTVNNNSQLVASNDILKPQRPSSDLWARNETPLRMPRMDEIAVMRSDDLLPEESLDAKPVTVAARVEKPTVTEKNTEHVSQKEMLAELNSLRSEIKRLGELQKQTSENIARERSVVARPEILDKFEPELVENHNGINVHREIVPMESNKSVTMRSVAKNAAEPTVARVSDMAKMSPNELKKAFKKTYLSENKHLSTYRVDDKFDTVSDMSVSQEGFTAQHDLSEDNGGVRPLEIKISFLNGDAGLSRENYTLLSEYASIVVNNPKRAIQIAIPESVTHDKDGRKLAAKRLAIVEQVLRDAGVAEQRVMPVLSQRNDDSFVLRIISGDLFETLIQQKRNQFGDSVSKKTYKSMSW